MSTFDFLLLNKEKIYKISLKNKASNIRVFGSVARGEEKDKSDIDFLVKFDSKSTLFDKINLSEELEELLKRKIDIISDSSIHWYLKETILNEVKYI